MMIYNIVSSLDPKWAELVKERSGNLSHDLQKRLPPGMSSSSGSKKGPGRPPLLGSPTGTNNPSPAVSSAASLTASSMASSMPFPSLAGASGLGGLNSNLLSSLSLGQFDPKTNPLLLPFGGMSNMSALSSMGGLGGLGNMNLFANLAGLGIPGLAAGMDALTGNTSGGGDGQASSSGNSGGNVKSSNKSRKSTSDSLNQGGSGNKQSSASSASSNNSNALPTTSPFPFFFPNPSLLYTPLGLGGLNPFTLQPGMSSAYDSLAQQCGLLNGTLGAAAAAAAVAGNNASPNSTSRSGKSGNTSSRSGSATAVTSTTTTSSSSSLKHQRTNSSSSGLRDPNAPLQQLLLPHDAHILESISRVAGSLDVAAVAAASKQAKNDKKEEKRKTLDSLSRAALLSEFAPSVEKLKSSKRDFLGHLGSPADLSKFMELPGSSPLSSASSSKRSRDQEMKEALEQLSKTPTEYIARSLSSVEERLSNKRPRESKDMAENLSIIPSKDDIEQPLPPTKKMKIDLPPSTTLEASSAPQTPTAPTISTSTPPIIECAGVDIESLLTPTTVVKGSAMTTPEIEEKILATASQYNITTDVANTSANSGQSSESSDELKAGTSTSSHASPGAATAKDVDSSESGENSSKKGGASGSSSNSGGRRTRGKRKPELDPEAPVIERKNLRSSAGRAAAAAAARQAAAKLQEAQAAAKLLEAAEEAADS